MGQVDKHDKQDEHKQRHFAETAVDALHSIEGSAADAYHAIEDHNTKELQQDVKGLLTRLAGWFNPKAQAFKAWYLAQPVYLKVVYGLTLVPVAALLSVITVLLIKFGGPLLLAIALILKLTIALMKMLFFIGYIGYKIIKTILMWYYTISRLYLGNKAKRKRFEWAQACQFPVMPSAAADTLTFRCNKKDLFIEHPEHGQIRVLFSYLRYALIGQLRLLQHVKNSWRRYFTIWQANSREFIKTELTPVGASMFTPHTLGADITAERVLVPGDAELQQVTVYDDASAELQFQIYWVNWHFKFRKALKFLQVRREPQQETWNVKAFFKHSEQTEAAANAADSNTRTV